jgi:PPOX class probable FMN-dependent enzyme
MAVLNTFQQTFGAPSEGAKKKVLDYMTPWVQNFIRQSPFCVMATSDAQGQCDASPKGGKPGFVKVLDEHHLLIPDIAGNRLFQSYENVEVNHQIGLIFFIPGENTMARVNGTVEVLTKPELEQYQVELSLFNPDENAKILQGMRLTVQEAYSHCPRALRFSNLWDVETINHNRNHSPLA